MRSQPIVLMLRLFCSVVVVFVVVVVVGGVVVFIIFRQRNLHLEVCFCCS